MTARAFSGGIVPRLRETMKLNAYIYAQNTHEISSEIAAMTIAHKSLQ
jgi:hypothetical protein